MLIVQEIHRRALYEGVGTHTMAEELNARGLRTHNGTRFQANTIRRILLDPEYMGYLITAEAMSPHLPDLEIIDEETKTQAIRLVQEPGRSGLGFHFSNMPRKVPAAASILNRNQVREPP